MIYLIFKKYTFPFFFFVYFFLLFVASFLLSLLCFLLFKCFLCEVSQLIILAAGYTVLQKLRHISHS
jgi:hypothetical protein